MEKKNYLQYHNQYKRRVKGCYLFALFLLIAGLFIGIFVFRNMWGTGLVALLCVSYTVLMYVQHRTDDIYISNIIMDLSRLLEQLMELEQQEIFPNNDDTLVSKLQNQIVRLIHILRKQNEREKREHENIKHLVSDISHQLKTPLSNLKMYTEFLRNDEITPEQKQGYLRVLDTSLERLLFLSESMIKVSRLESGLIQLDCQKTDINQTILKAIKDAYAKAKENQIEIRYEEGFTGQIVHDSKWTSEAVYNLIDNAIKYGQIGNIITVSIRELGMMIEISVEDQNQPINKMEYNSIFERFYRGEGSSKIEGVGIGLYLAREIIEKQGGCVSVKPGQEGNRFMVVLAK